MVTKPAEFADWCASGDPSIIVDPPTPLHTVGWAEGEGIPFEYLNWLFYILDQWIQYLDQNSEPANVIVKKTISFTVTYPAAIYLCVPAGSSINATLPAASTPAVFTIKNQTYDGSKTVIVVLNGGDTVEGAAGSVTLNPGDSIRLATAGDGNWSQLTG